MAAPPQYVVVPADYEDLLHRGYQARAGEARERAELQLQHLGDRLAQDVSVLQLAADVSKEECSRLKDEILTWRKKACLYKMRLASAAEATQLGQENQQALEQHLEVLTEEREQLLLCNRQLQEQLQGATALCRGEHRLKVVQQGQLESTSAEVEQLQAHLQGARAEGEALLALKQELEGALAGARSDGEGLRQQLSAVSAALQAHQTAQAQLEAKHKALQAQARAVHEQLGDARARAERLEKQLALREAELQAEQARLLSHLQGQAREADQTTQLSQHIKAADNAVINAQRQSIEQLAGQLDGDRKAAEQARTHLQEMLQQELKHRRSAEAEVAAQRKRLLELEASHISSQGALQKQIAEKDAASSILQTRLAFAEAQVATRDKQVADMQQLLDRSTRQLGDKVSNRDAAVEALQRQADEQRKQLAQKAQELRELQQAHQQEVRQLQQQLLRDREEAAAELEARLKRQAIDKERTGSSAEAGLRQQVSELQSELAQRNTLIQQLQQLQRQLAKADTAGAEQQVKSAKQQLGRLVGNLVNPQAAGHEGGAATDDTEDDADLQADMGMILNMSQRRLSQGPGALLGARVEAAVQPAAPAVPQQGSQEPGPAAGGRKRAPAAAGEDAKPAGKGARARKAPKAAAAERLEDVGRATSGADTTTSGDGGARDADGVTQDEQPPAAGRAHPQRHAAQQVQARARAQLAAFDEGSESDSHGREDAETPGYELKQPKQPASKRPRIGAQQQQRGGAGGELAPGPGVSSIDEEEPEAADAAAPQAAAKSRSRPAKGVAAKAAAVQQQAAATASGRDAAGGAADAGPSGQPPQPAARAAAAPAERAGRSSAAGRAEADDADSDADWDVVPATQQDVVLATQDDGDGDDGGEAPGPSQPSDPLQRQLGGAGAAAAARPAGQGLLAGAAAGASQLGPTSSKATSFFSQGLFANFNYSSQVAQNPLAALNRSVLDHAKLRRQLVPLATLNTLKPLARANVPPRGAGNGQLTGAKRKLPQPGMGLLGGGGGNVRTVPGDTLPNDMLLKSLQQPKLLRKADDEL